MAVRSASARMVLSHRRESKALRKLSFRTPLEQQRIELRSSSRVWSAAAQFWATLGKQLGETMSRDQYTYVHRRISKALAPELTDQDAHEAAREDWVEDLAGHAEMTLARFVDGLLSICDMWVDSCNEFEYAMFLDRLYRRITIGSGVPRLSMPSPTPAPARVVARPNVRPSFLLREYHKLDLAEKLTAVGALRAINDSGATISPVQRASMRRMSLSAHTSEAVAEGAVTSVIRKASRLHQSATAFVEEASLAPSEHVRHYRGVDSIAPLDGCAPSQKRGAATTEPVPILAEGATSPSISPTLPQASSLDLAFGDSSRRDESPVPESPRPRAPSRAGSTIVHYAGFGVRPPSRNAPPSSRTSYSLKRRCWLGWLDDPDLPGNGLSEERTQTSELGDEDPSTLATVCKAVRRSLRLRSNSASAQNPQITHEMDALPEPVVVVARRVSFSKHERRRASLPREPSGLDDSRDGANSPRPRDLDHQVSMASWPSRRSMLQGYIDMHAGDADAFRTGRFSMEMRRLGHQLGSESDGSVPATIRETVATEEEEVQDEQEHDASDDDDDSGGFSFYFDDAGDDDHESYVLPAPVVPPARSAALSAGRAAARQRPPSRCSPVPGPNMLQYIGYFDRQGEAIAIAHATALAKVPDGELPPSTPKAGDLDMLAFPATARRAALLREASSTSHLFYGSYPPPPFQDGSEDTEEARPPTNRTLIPNAERRIPNLVSFEWRDSGPKLMRERRNTKPPLNGSSLPSSSRPTSPPSSPQASYVDPVSRRFQLAQRSSTTLERRLHDMLQEVIRTVGATGTGSAVPPRTPPSRPPSQPASPSSLHGQFPLRHRQLKSMSSTEQELYDLRRDALGSRGSQRSLGSPGSMSSRRSSRPNTPLRCNP